ncbi:MAG: metallophosphoesterase [Proteobacteria bacterium]|nr:metallophosphoesterase [Pseudomonadota bacterium]HQR03172.1 metallophosphoesterase [Rhodocyclaceae bacterium]
MRPFPFIRTLALLTTALALGACQHANFRNDLPATAPKPWNSEHFNTAPGNFRFAVFGDRTGLARPGVFERAMTRINLLQPEFAINCGDMIEGYTDDQGELKLEWDEQDARIAALKMPFFRVVGNHDMGSNVMREFWRERYGPDYYSFVYKDVLFIALNTEDPPIPMPEEMRKQFEMVKKLMRTDPEKGKAVITQAMAAMSGKERDAMREHASPANFSETQIAWVQDVLKKNPQVRWTFLFMHKPAWEMESPGFKRIEAMLQGRSYTVFGSHEHNYEHTVHNGHDYIRLGTVGGAIHHAPPGNLDHVTVVSFIDGKPSIANFPLDGVLDIDEPQKR